MCFVLVGHEDQRRLFVVVVAPEIIIAASQHTAACDIWCAFVVLHHKSLAIVAVRCCCIFTGDALLFACALTFVCCRNLHRYASANAIFVCLLFL